jgi:hypothetical protein
LANLQAELKGEFENLARSYARLSRDVGGRMDFACDLDSDDALAAAEQEKSYLQQAFFVIGFGALERQITLLASAKLADPYRAAAMRDAPFERRLEIAIKVAQEALNARIVWGAAAPAIRSWYGIRNEIAHGQPATQLFDVLEVIYCANEVAATLDQVNAAVKE